LGGPQKKAPAPVNEKKGPPFSFINGGGGPINERKKIKGGPRPLKKGGPPKKKSQKN